MPVSSRLRVVSSVQQSSVPLQHVCCSSCSLSDLLASHYSELLSAFFLFFCTYAGILFLVFVLFRPCSSYLFLFSTYAVLLAAFLIFLHHILQNSCRFFVVFLVLIFLIFLVWLVLLCSRTRYASISLALPGLNAVVLFLLCLTVCDHRICISLGWRISTDMMPLSRKTTHTHWYNYVPHTCYVV